MKLSLSILIPALCWSARLASAAAAHIYTFDTESEPRLDGRTLDPAAARLLLAQRAGVEDYHSADLMSSGAIQAVNDFGVRDGLFSNGKRRRAFVLAESVHEDESKRYTISPGPCLSVH